MLSLRPYQDKAVGGVRTSYTRGKKAPLLVAPTGAGKTIMFSYVAQQATSKKKNVYILVHRVELLRQTSKALGKAGVLHGLVNPKYTPNMQAPAQVASVQTLIKRMDKFFSACPPDLIIVDEAHHASAGTWKTVIQTAQAFNPKCLILGVTATPERADGKGLGVNSGGLFDDLILGPTVAELIEMKFLVKPVIFAPPVAADLTGVKMSGGDYDREQLAERMSAPGITGDAVKHYRKVCPGVPAVVFCVNIKHAEQVAAEFAAAGFRAFSVDGKTEATERDRILAGLGETDTTGRRVVEVVASCDLISEGTDIPAIGCAILLRATASLGLYIQQVGRALRPCEGKDFAFILDHVGNVGAFVGGQFVPKHGLPEADREWSLEGRKARNKKSLSVEAPEVKIQQCEKCYNVQEPGPVCLSCGHIFIIKEKRKLTKTDGELQEITPEAAQIIKKQARQEVGRAETLADLEKLAAARGYKPNWAKHVFASRQKKSLQI